MLVALEGGSVAGWVQRDADGTVNLKMKLIIRGRLLRIRTVYRVSVLAPEGAPHFKQTL